LIDHHQLPRIQIHLNLQIYIYIEAESRQEKIMQTREIEKINWQSFFDQVSRALQGKLIKIEVDSLELGAQIEADKLSLNGLTYDRKDDAFVITTDEIEHVIHSPQQIFVADGTEGMNSLKISSADGTEQIISFVEPLALPPPA
jgi:hypothetical protein